MDLGLSGKGCVVLASSGGLGRAVAAALLDEGARVSISGRDPARLARTRDELGAEREERVHAEALDVTDGAALERHLRAAEERWGRVDVLVANAGGPPPGRAEDVGDDELDRAFEVTLRSAVRAVRLVLPAMKASGWGRVLAMTSSSVRQPIAGLALSNTMRAGLTGWLKTLADEVGGSGVTVNSVCTGMFDTGRLRELIRARAERSGRSPADEERELVGRIPVGRLGDPAEFGAFCAFLVSERAAFLNGVAVPFDGGASRGLF